VRQVNSSLSHQLPGMLHQVIGERRRGLRCQRNARLLPRIRLAATGTGWSDRARKPAKNRIEFILPPRWFQGGFWSHFHDLLPERPTNVVVHVRTEHHQAQRFERMPFRKGPFDSPSPPYFV